MDGLECSEINISELEFSGRIDAEYYQKHYLTYEEEVRKRNSKKMCDLCKFLIGPFGSAYNTSNYVEESHYRYVRGQDVKPFYLQSNSPRFMDENDYLRLQKYALEENDILISVVGTLGNACIIQKQELPAIFSCKSTAIRTLEIDPYYLLAYLNSKYGKQLLLRKERGAIQKGLNLDDLKLLDVPILSSLFQNTIRRVIVESLKVISNAVSSYEEAESILENELGFDVNALPERSITEKSFLKSFKSSGRLDAEYYHPKYDGLYAALNKLTTKFLGSIVDIKKSIEPGSNAYTEKGIPFVRVSDVSKFELSQTELYLPSDIVSDTETLFPKRDTILFSKDGSVGIAYKVEKNMSIITSGALLHLMVKDTCILLPDYLTLVLNSPIVQLQAERDSNGAIIQHWKPSEIEKVVIPVLDIEIQKRIAAKVQESFDCRRKSKELLENAKKSVEMAIEQGEEVALSWLQDLVD